MKLQIFMIFKKFLRWALIILSILDSVLNKDGNYYLQVFLKKYKYMEKKGY